MQVEIRYLFRFPVSRCVHARFLHNPKKAKKVDVGYLSFHTSPTPSSKDKLLFEARRSELLEWRAQGGQPPIIPFGKMITNEKRKAPKAR